LFALGVMAQDFVEGSEPIDRRFVAPVRLKGVSRSDDPTWGSSAT
jgi:hypothetical protein